MATPLSTLTLDALLLRALGDEERDPCAALLAHASAWLLVLAGTVDDPAIEARLLDVWREVEAAAELHRRATA